MLLARMAGICYRKLMSEHFRVGEFGPALYRLKMHTLNRSSSKAKLNQKCWHTIALAAWRGKLTRAWTLLLGTELKQQYMLTA
jgi:hypothetical protein